MEPSTPLQAGNEEVDFGVARPQEEGLGLSPIREAARSRNGSAPPGFASRDVLTVLEVVDLMEERHRVRDEEKRLYARLLRLEESPKTCAEVELFLTAVEEMAERAGLPDKLYELAINQMSITLATSYHRLAVTKFPGLSPTYERLVEAMVGSVAPGKPKGHLLKEIRTLEAGKMGVWPLREQLDRMYQSYLALCRRTRKVPVITEQIVVGIYLRYLPEELGAQVRNLASDADLETFYAAAKFAAARENRRTTHPLLRGAWGLTKASGDVTGLPAFTGEFSGSRDPVLADQEPRAPALPVAMGVNRPGAPFQEESAKPPVPDRRREGFSERHARPIMSSPRVPPRPYIPKTQYGFEDGRDQGHQVPRGRAVDRRYYADPRPARWPQVHMTNVHPQPPELARSTGPSFHSMAPRRVSEFQPAAVAGAGWNPCFACGQTGHRLMNCAKYLQDCARAPFGASRCPACNALGLCPADCRRRLYFATPPYPHLELNKTGTSYFSRCGLQMSRWYRPELLSDRLVSPHLLRRIQQLLSIGRHTPFIRRLC